MENLATPKVYSQKFICGLAIGVAVALVGLGVAGSILVRPPAPPPQIHLPLQSCAYRSSGGRWIESTDEAICDAVGDWVTTALGQPTPNWGFDTNLTPNEAVLVDGEGTRHTFAVSQTFPFRSSPPTGEMFRCNAFIKFADHYYQVSSVPDLLATPTPKMVDEQAD